MAVFPVWVAWAYFGLAILGALVRLGLLCVGEYPRSLETAKWEDAVSVALNPLVALFWWFAATGYWSV